MRTKALLLSAALVAAGVASSMAQSNVYSLNIVGYVNVPIPQGFSIIANPLDDGLADGNVISSVITSTNTPDGSLAYCFSQAAGYNIEQYFAGFGWFPGTNDIAPGRGFFYFSPVATNITFVGQIAAGSYTNALLQGFNLSSSVVPEALRLGVPGVTNTLGIPAQDGDLVYRFDKAKYNGYDIVQYFAGFGWFDSDTSDTDTNGPVLNVGEGVFISKGSAANWVQSFSVN